MVYKVVVTGAFNAGKSVFISTASDIPVVSTERRISDDLADVKETTTVAMDYGQVTIDDSLFHLYGTPGQERFDFMWDILAREMDAFLVLADSADRSSLTIARRILRGFRRKSKVPFLVVATKQDARRALSPGKMASSLKLAPSQVVPCDPRERSSVIETLRQLVSILE